MGPVPQVVQAERPWQAGVLAQLRAEFRVPAPPSLPKFGGVLFAEVYVPSSYLVRALDRFLRARGSGAASRSAARRGLGADPGDEAGQPSAERVVGCA